MKSQVAEKTELNDNPQKNIAQDDLAVKKVLQDSNVDQDHQE